MSDIGSSKFIFHQIHAMEFTNCLSAFDGRRHDTKEATTMTAEQLFNRKFLKKRQCNHMSIPGCFYWGLDALGSKGLKEGFYPFQGIFYIII